MRPPPGADAVRELAETGSIVASTTPGTGAARGSGSNPGEPSTMLAAKADVAAVIRDRTGPENAGVGTGLRIATDRRPVR
jgi:hypothetical protein